MVDPIADMLSRIRNAQAVGHPTVDVPYSRIRLAVAKILEREGYVEAVHRRGRGAARRRIEITLRYHDGQPLIQHMRRVSKPGRRVYRGARALRSVLGGHGHTVLSTSSGIMTDQEARRNNVGGEVLFEIW